MAAIGRANHCNINGSRPFGHAGQTDKRKRFVTAIAARASERGEMAPPDVLPGALGVVGRHGLQNLTTELA